MALLLAATEGWILGDCFGEVCTFAFSVACSVEMRDVRLFFPSRPGSDVSPATQKRRSLVRYATQHHQLETQFYIS